MPRELAQDPQIVAHRAAWILAALLPAKVGFSAQPECFAHLRRLLEARLNKRASREYIQVLRLIEHFAFEEVTAAIEQALALNAISFDAVRHLVLCRIERRPPRLDMANWPHLPLAQVRTTQAADYMSLLSMPTAEPPTLEATL